MARYSALEIELVVFKPGDGDYRRPTLTSLMLTHRLSVMHTIGSFLHLADFFGAFARVSRIARFCVPDMVPRNWHDVLDIANPKALTLNRFQRLVGQDWLDKPVRRLFTTIRFSRGMCNEYVLPQLQFVFPPKVPRTVIFKDGNWLDFCVVQRFLATALDVGDHLCPDTVVLENVSCAKNLRLRISRSTRTLCLDSQAALEQYLLTKGVYGDNVSKLILSKGAAVLLGTKFWSMHGALHGLSNLVIDCKCDEQVDFTALAQPLIALRARSEGFRITLTGCIRRDRITKLLSFVDDCVKHDPAGQMQKRFGRLVDCDHLQACWRDLETGKKKSVLARKVRVSLDALDGDDQN